MTITCFALNYYQNDQGPGAGLEVETERERAWRDCVWGEPGGVTDSRKRPCDGCAGGRGEMIRQTNE